MLRIPDTLTEQAAGWQAQTREEVLSAFHDPSHPLLSIESHEFTQEVRDALAAPPHRVAGGLSVECPPAAAAMLMGHLLGGVHDTSLGSLEGPVSLCAYGGGGLKYDQDWHTDSSPWATPNRWTVLALLEPDSQRPDMATSVVPGRGGAGALDGGPSLDRRAAARRDPLA